MLLSRRLWTLVLGLALVGSAHTAEGDRYLPEETEKVVVINIKQMMGSPIIKKNLLSKIEDAIKENKDLKALQQATGLDLLKDVHAITVGNTGKPGDKVTLIVHGKFDVDRLSKVLEAVAKEKPDELKI